MPSEIPMSSPNALSPSGLKSNSQFYPSYEASNARRRPSQDPIGKIVKDVEGCWTQSWDKFVVTDFVSEKVFFVLILYLSISSLLLLSF